MQKEAASADEKEKTNEAEQEQKPSFFSKKLLFLGIAVFLVQVVIVYFVTAKFVVPLASSQKKEQPLEETVETGEQAPQHLFVVKDIIVNPAGTNGTRFLLTTIGFEVSSLEAQMELEAREVQVRDVLNTILTSRGLDELVDVQRREDVRRKILKQVSDMMRKGKLSNVYFSKFIIQ